MLARTTLALSAIAISALSFAQATALVTAPATTIRTQDELQSQLRATSTNDNLDSQYFLSTRHFFGPIKDLEIGFDSNFLGVNRFGAKYMVYKNPAEQLFLSVGITDISNERDLYVAAMKRFEQFDLHFGAQQAQTNQAFIAARTPFINDFRFTAEYVSSASGSLGARVDYKLQPNLWLDYRIVQSNANGAPARHLFGINFFQKF